MEYQNQIIGAIVLVVTSYLAWILGGRQKSKNDTNDSITKGTDSLINTLEKLIEIANENIESERTHRLSCEKSLGEHKIMIDQLRKEIDQLKRKMK